MIKKTLAGTLATLALAGAAATSAQAATPINQTAPAASAHQVAPKPMYSKSFLFGNQLGDSTDMVLTSAYGDNEGLPPVGSVMHGLDSQDFEVQYKAGDTGVVYASYDLINRVNGAWIGDVTIKMSYGCFGETSTTIVGEHNLSNLIQLGSLDGHAALTW